MLPSHSKVKPKKNNLVPLLLLVLTTTLGVGSSLLLLLSTYNAGSSLEKEGLLSSASYGGGGCPPPPPSTTLVNSTIEKWSLPIYYINMDEDIARHEYMQSLFSHRVEHLYRVPAVKTIDMEVLLKHLDPGSVQDRERLIKDKHYETFRVYKALPGQIGNMISHMKAIELAYNHGDEYAIIMEDDVGDATISLWPYKDLSTLIEIANTQYNNKWKVIRLQWNDYDWSLKRIHDEWLKNMNEWSEKTLTNKSHTTYIWDSSKDLPFYHDIPLLQPLPQGWGNVAALFNRQGMKSLLDIHRRVQIKEEEDDGDGGGDNSTRWRCNPKYPCQADISFWQELGHDATLVVVPPLLTYRLAEVQTTAIRAGEVKKDHKKLHLQSLLTTFQWLLEFQEFFRVGGGLDNIPHKYIWSVSSSFGG